MNSNDTLHAGLLAASVLGFLAIVSVGAAPVRAAEATTDSALSHEEVHVTFVRQDLSSSKAAGKLYNDLRKASAKVCGKSNTRSGDLATYALYQACYRQTLHDAVQQVNSPSLFAIYSSFGKVGRG
jgi:UrcA family protein